LIRARTFNPTWGTSRAAQCLRAAMALARSSHDETLTADILAEIDRSRLSNSAINHHPRTHPHPSSVDSDALDLILKNERKAEAYPESPATASAFVVPDSDASEDNDSSPFGAGAFFAEDDDDEDSEPADLLDFASPAPDDNFDSTSEPFFAELFKGMPQGFRARLAQIIRNSGLSPEDIQQDPRKFLEAVAASAGLSVEELNRASGLPESLPFNTFPPSIPRQRQRNKKRRRR
jgi:hypothetical protein